MALTASKVSTPSSITYNQAHTPGPNLRGPLSITTNPSHNSLGSKGLDQTATPVSLQGQPTRSERWNHLKREPSLLRQQKQETQPNWDSSSSEAPNRVSTPPPSHHPQTTRRASSSSSPRVDTLRISSPNSPFQNRFTGSSSSLSSTISYSSNSDATFVNSSSVLTTQNSPSSQLRNQNASGSVPFTLSGDASNTSTMGNHFTPESRRRSQKPYLQHAVLNQSQVPKHAISSARMSKHLNVPLKMSNTNQGQEFPENGKSESTKKRNSQSFSNKDYDEDSPSTSTRDSLQVNVMKLPKNFYQQNLSMTNLAAPSSAPPMRSSVMSVIPPMQNVWLDDDEEDDEKQGKKEIFKTHIMRSKQKSTTSVNRYSTSESSYDAALTRNSSKRRNRKSFGYGRDYDADGQSMMEKIKSSFSSKSTLGSTLDPVIQSPVTESSADFKRQSWMLEPKMSHISTTSTTHNIPLQKPGTSHSSKVRSSMQFFPGSLHRHPSNSKISTVSSKSSMRTLPTNDAMPPTRRKSTKSKLFSLLTSKSGKSGKPNSESSHSSSRTVDKSKISGPLDFTHTNHAGGAPLMSTSSIATTRSRIQPPRPDRPNGPEIPNGFDGNTPPLSSSSASSFQRSSFIASPNTSNIPADNISISTTSADEYSPSSSNKHHRLFFSRLLNAPGSRSSFHGVDSLDERGLSKRPSIESLTSERYLHPTVSPARYSLNPSSIRARSRLSIHSTLSIDSNISYSAYPASGNFGSGGMQPADDHRSVLTPTPLVPIQSRASSQELTHVPNSSGKSEYEGPSTGLDRVREEGWF